MTKTIRFGAAGIAMFAALGMSSAAHADTETANASVEILDALVLTNTAGLDFGALVVSGTGGTVSLSSDGTAAGNLDCSDADITCSGTTSISAFTIAGTASKDVTITVPTGDVNLDHPDYVVGLEATHRIILNGFADSEGGSVTLDGTGAGGFDVGGSVTVTGSEVAGSYTGTFDVTVAYS